MPSLSPNAKQQFFTNAGVPAIGYKLYTYAAGTGFGTPQATYTDQAALSANTNPIILDARGEAVLYLPAGLVYDYALKDALDNTIWTRTKVSAGVDSGDLASTDAGKGSSLIGYLAGTVKSFLDSLATDIGATLIRYKASFTGAVQRTLGAAAEDQINSAWFGVDNTGATAASAKLQLAITAAAGKTLVIKPGTYLIDATLLVNSYTTIMAYGCTFVRNSTLNNFIRNNANGTTGVYSANVGINIFGGVWNSTGGTGNCTPITLVHTSRCQIRDVEIYNENQFHHIEVNSSDDVVIEHCYFNGGYTTAAEGAESIQIDCASDTSWPGPYDETPCQNIVVRNCHFESVSSCVGSHTEPASSNHSRILVTDCFANTVMMAFVKAIAWSDVKIINNKAQNIGFGVLLNEAVSTLRSQNDIEIIGNTFYNVGQTTFTRINSGGIILNGNATNTTSRPINVRIANNFIYNCTTTGLHAIGTQFTQRMTVTGNIINTSQGCGIYAYGGQNVTVTGNTASGNNSIANASYASIKLGGTGVVTDTNVCVVTGNTCDTLIADWTNRTVVTGNVFLTSAAMTNSSTSGKLINNMTGTTWA